VPTTAAQWQEQAYHWERSTGWASAMHCYYSAAMVLKGQGDSLTARTHFTAAFRMMDKMRHDAGVQHLDGHRVATTASTAEAPHLPTCAATNIPIARGPRIIATEAEVKQLAVEGFEYILCGRNLGLSGADVFKMFEGSSETLYLGLSVVVRLAQSLISSGAQELAYRLFEDCLDIIYAVKCTEPPLTDRDGGVFTLRNKDIVFLVLSGMCVLLMDSIIQDPQRHQKLICLVKLSLQFGHGMGADGEVHLIYAYLNKLWLVDHFLPLLPSAAQFVLPFTDLLLALYDREKHNDAILYYYNSNRVGNGVCIAVRLLCMQGRFSEALKYLDFVRTQAAKLKNAFSRAMTIASMYAVQLIYFPSAQVQLVYNSFLRDKVKFGSLDWHNFAPLFAEGVAQHLRLQQFRASGDEDVYVADADNVEEMLHSAEMLQYEQSREGLNRMRLYSSAVEYVSARTCYYKALRYEQLHTQQPHRDTARNLQRMGHYLQLGLLHITFLPDQDERNRGFLFASVHEKLLRVQLLLKYLQYYSELRASPAPVSETTEDGITEARSVVMAAARARVEAPYQELWERARSDLQYVRELAEKSDFQGVLFQVGTHMQTLAALATTAAADPNVALFVDPAVLEGLTVEGAQLYETATQFMQANNSDSVDVLEVVAAVLVSPPEGGSAPQ
jgi:hypothetical protein